MKIYLTHCRTGLKPASHQSHTNPTSCSHSPQIPPISNPLADPKSPCRSQILSPIPNPLADPKSAQERDHFVQMVRRIFVGYDADQSGTLEFGEFRRCLTESQLGLSDKQISYLMSVSDVRAAHSHLQRSTLHVSSLTLFTPPALDASDLQRSTLFTPPAFEFALRSTCVHLVSTFCSLRVHLVSILCT